MCGRDSTADEAETEAAFDDDWFKCCKTLPNTNDTTESIEVAPDTTCEVSLDAVLADDDDDCQT